MELVPSVKRIVIFETIIENENQLPISTMHEYATLDNLRRGHLKSAIYRWPRKAVNQHSSPFQLDQGGSFQTAIGNLQIASSKKSSLGSLPNRFCACI